MIIDLGLRSDANDRKVKVLSYDHVVVPVRKK
jgi:hypothetical protein